MSLQPSTVPAIHKRYAEKDVRAYDELPKMTREKRFTSFRFERFQFGENDTVSYSFDPNTRSAIHASLIAVIYLVF